MKEMTYAKAGVNIDLENDSIKAIVSEATKTLSFRKGKVGESLVGIGHFSGLIKIDEKRALAVSTDGVGSKILIAEMLGKYDTIGIDCVAMNVDDVLCVGAEPITMLDYLAMEKPDPKITEEVGKGLKAGAEIARISISGGELASLPDIIKGVDLAGTAIGIVDIDKIITGDTIGVNDVVIGLESSGVHSNGLTLARKVLLEKYKLSDKIGNRTVGEELLMPTKIYVREVLDVIKNVTVKGLAHITGGGLGNLTRITKYGYFMDALPEPQRIFKEIQKIGKVSDREMYRTFNMGIGFCIIVNEKDADKTIEICKKHGTKAYKIGKIVEEEGVRIKGKDFVMKY